MPKKLYVTLDDDEYCEIERLARTRQISVVEWIGAAIDVARREEADGNVARKLAAIRAAAKYESATGDIDTMLAEIERGYTSSIEGK